MFAIGRHKDGEEAEDQDMVLRKSALANRTPELSTRIGKVTGTSKGHPHHTHEQRKNETNIRQLAGPPSQRYMASVVNFGEPDELHF